MSGPALVGGNSRTLRPCGVLGSVREGVLLRLLNELEDIDETANDAHRENGCGGEDTEGGRQGATECGGCEGGRTSQRD